MEARRQVLEKRRRSPIKARSESCYRRKVARRTKQWENSPKIQAKYTLEEWIRGIYGPRTRR